MGKLFVVGVEVVVEVFDVVVWELVGMNEIVKGVWGCGVGGG